VSELKIFCDVIAELMAHLTHLTLFPILQYFGSIKNLGLGAEHGFYYKWPREEELPFSGTLIVLLHLFCLFVVQLLFSFYLILWVCVVLHAVCRVHGYYSQPATTTIICDFV